MSTVSGAVRPPILDVVDGNESGSSGVSWPAIAVGAVVAAAMGFALTTLGAGIGLSSVSPWSRGASAAAVANGALAWMVSAQAISAIFGGYVAGRLRTKWVGVHSDEVYFRDTAHGFAVWAVSVVLTAVIGATAMTAVVEGGANVAGHAAEMGVAAGTSAMANAGSNPAAYYADTLLRSDTAAHGAEDPNMRGEVARIIVAGVRDGKLSDADEAYLAQVVAARTGLSAADAQARVASVTGEARQAAARVEEAARSAAEAARKSAAHFAYWLFAGLLLAAFLSSFAATLGGRQRDHVHG